MEPQTKFKRWVTRVTQSPLNPERWVLDLNCGHEIWVNSRTRPTRRAAECPKCAKLELVKAEVAKSEEARPR